MKYIYILYFTSKLLVKSVHLTISISSRKYFIQPHKDKKNEYLKKETVHKIFKDAVRERSLRKSFRHIQTF